MPARDEDGTELTLESLDRRLRAVERRGEDHDVLVSFFGKIGGRAIGGAVAISAIGSFLMLAFGKG